MMRHAASDPPANTAAVAMGSNLGDREALLLNAVASMASLPGCDVIAASSFHETDPVGPGVQGRYLNAAVLLSTTMPARDLLDALLDIERNAGRDRSGGERWSARTLDLDLLLFGDATIDEPGLVVPHPRMHERLFVLAPLAEIAPHLPVPGLNANVGELLATCTARQGR